MSGGGQCVRTLKGHALWVVALAVRDRMLLHDGRPAGSPLTFGCELLETGEIFSQVRAREHQD